MATSLLKPVQEKPARILIHVPQQLAARLRQLEAVAETRRIAVDVNGPLTAALEKLVAAAERDLSAGSSTAEISGAS